MQIHYPSSRHNHMCIHKLNYDHICAAVVFYGDFIVETMLFGDKFFENTTDKEAPLPSSVHSSY